MKRLLTIILALSLVFLSCSALTACSGHEDNNNDVEDSGGILDSSSDEILDTGSDGILDTGSDEILDSSSDVGEETGETTNSPLELIKDGVTNFNIVYSGNADNEVVGAINGWVSSLAEFGVEVKAVLDTDKASMQDCEILIGTGLANREDYGVDFHDYGEKGYVIKVVGEKVVVFGGSTEATLDVMHLFLENYIGINIDTIEVKDVSVAKTLYVEKVQDDYPIKNLTVNGKSIKDMYIAADTANEYDYAAARILQDSFYTYAGAWIPISMNGKGLKINVKTVSNAGEDGFKVFVDGGELNIHCAYYNSFSKGMNSFVNDVLAKANGTLDFTNSYHYSTCVSVVTYSEFGAKGTGNVDDFAAIIATHEFANECGQRVEADEGAKYYIRESLKTAIIKTDVNWKDAEFIIDDSEIKMGARGYWIFRVVPDKPSYTAAIPKGYSLKKTDTNIGMTFDTKVMILIVNANKKVYIREGTNANNGTNQQEMIIVEPNGDLDPLTPLIFDYDQVTSMTVYPVDDAPLTIQGGIFTTWSNQQVSASAYYARGLCVQRSNTIVYNVTHLIDKEPEEKSGACPYTGFFYVEQANNVTFDSCVMSGHKMYKTLQSDGDYVSQGTYDTQAVKCNAITWKNCTQANDINDDTYWGVMASNFCKNLAWENCVLSRFDAHQGVYNVSIKNSQVGETINLIGSGTAYFENVTRTSGKNAYFISLRTDYGATWEGDVIIKNCELVVSNSTTKAYVISATWKNHWFGYNCYLPDLYIDGFNVVKLNGNAFNKSLHLFKNIASNYVGDIREDETNPLFAPKIITTKGITYTGVLAGTNNDVILSDTVITKED